MFWLNNRASPLSEQGQSMDSEGLDCPKYLQKTMWRSPLDISRAGCSTVKGFAGTHSWVPVRTKINFAGGGQPHPMKSLISLEDALIMLVLYHDRYLFQNRQQQHVHDLRAISDLRRRRNLKRSEKLITNYEGLRSLLR
jgi:hypothetical protein